MKTSDIISLENIIGTLSLESISRKLQEIAATIRYEHNPSTVETLKNEQHLHTLARAFKIWETNEPASTVTTTLEKMACWFSEQTMLENYRALTLCCFNTYFKKNIPGSIDTLHIIMLGKAFIADPIKYAGYLFWLLENNLNPRNIDDSRLTQQFFAYHAFELDVIKNTYQFFENISDKTAAFLHYFSEISSQMRGFINAKISNNAFRSYNVLGTQYDHPQEQFFYAPESQQLLAIDETPCYELNDTVSLYELFDWAFIELLNLEFSYHRRIIEYILKHHHAEKFLISFSERALTGEVSLQTALRMIDMIKTFWKTKSAIEVSRKITLLTNHPFLIHSLAGNINLGSHLTSGLNAFQQPQYQSLTHLPFLCLLYNHIPEALFYSEDHQETLIKIIFNIIAEHGNTLSNTTLRYIEPIAHHLKAIFREFLMMHQKTLTLAIEQFTADQIDFEAVETAWNNQLSLVNLTIYLYPELKDDIKLPYDKYDLYAAVVDKIAALSAPANVTKFQQFLPSFQNQIGLAGAILQETLKRTTQQYTRDLILHYVGLKDAFIALTTQPMLNERNLVFYAVKSLNFDLLTFILSTSENSTLVDTVQKVVIDCFNEIMTLHSEFYSALNSSNWTLITVLLPYLKNNERFIALIKLLLTEAINGSYHSFIIFLLSKEHLSFLTPQFIAQTLLKKVGYFSKRDQETALLLCGMKTQTLKAPGLIEENNLALYFSYVRQSIEQLSQSERNHITIVYDDMRILQHDDRTGTLTNPFLILCDEKENNILHLAAQHGHFETLKMILEALERQSEDDEIFRMLGGKNTEGNIPCAQGDHPVAREINAYLKRQYDRYKQPHDDLLREPSPSLPGNDNAFFNGNRKRTRVNSPATTVLADNDNTEDSDSDLESYQADTLHLLRDRI